MGFLIFARFLVTDLGTLPPLVAGLTTVAGSPAISTLHMTVSAKVPAPSLDLVYGLNPIRGSGP